MLPPGFISDLKNAVSLSSIARRYVRLKKAGNEYCGLCPFHKENTPSFTINDEKGFYHCFGCGAHGSVFSFIQNMERIDFLKAVEIVASHAGVSIPSATRESISDNFHEQREEMYSAMNAACKWFCDNLNGNAPAAKYLASRGICSDEIKRFKLGWAPRSGLFHKMRSLGISSNVMQKCGLISQNEIGEVYDKFRERVMFPIFDRRGRVIAFGGRSIDGAAPKYLNSPITELFSKGLELYGAESLHNCRSDSVRVLIVEGYLDVIAAQRVMPAVASLGTSLSEEQILHIWKFCREPIICFDGDTAGFSASLRAAEKMLPLLRPGHTAFFCNLEHKEDPHSIVYNDSSGDRLRKIAHDAVPLCEFLWKNSVGMEGAREERIPERRAYNNQKFKEWVSLIKDDMTKKCYMDFYYEKRRHYFDNISGKNRLLIRKTETIAFTKTNACSPSTNQLRILFAIIVFNPEIIPHIEESISMINIPEECFFSHLDKKIYEELTLLRDGFPSVTLSKLPRNSDVDGMDWIVKHFEDSGKTDCARACKNLADVKPHANLFSKEKSAAEIAEKWTEFFCAHQEKINKTLEIDRLKIAMLNSKTEESWNHLRKMKEFYINRI
ncbi:DNA primase [Candidatus Hydrogenosomobacter endosymbioticus]|uniref:DNA primase n=1 Tax=Candidatus Hydrogenosomobacter endosymbioticus TaxID=2558174 RepID=A0ABM7V8B6_9PROT|nr:DNA primase [Candidatus Hydrogenosomobacter endosymbioticus]BDB96021.1 hypothetical protein HYD_1540 [Candidatus Hydrogenosomobacter endosymbioticus]